MGFTEKQVGALQRKLDGAYVRTREVQGRTLSYIEGWHAIAEANRIFGFDGWDRETVESRCVLDRVEASEFHAVYVARVRITVRAEGHVVVREGYGTGEAQNGSAGSTHEKALKTAETDATKRALATFGKPFGLSLYVSPRNGKSDAVFNPLPGTTPIPEHLRRRTQQRTGRNGRYTVAPRTRGALDPAIALPTLPMITLDQLGASAAVEPSSKAPATDASSSHTEGRSLNGMAATEQLQGAIGSPPLQPPASGVEAASQSDTPRLLIEWPKRRRDPEHLKHVRTQPCLICSRTPCDAHHLKFTQPRGVKPSDEFTVPLCRVHHDELHRSGKEIDWWSAMDRDVDPLQIAKSLWEESRRKLDQEPSDNGTPRR